MNNILFTGLVVFALNTAKDGRREYFQPRLLELIKDLKMTKDWDDLQWYSAVHVLWENKVPATVLIDLLSEFKNVIRTAEIDQLMALGMRTRQELIAANTPDFQNEIKAVYTSYVVQWSDDTEMAYTCRVLGLEPGQINVGTLINIVNSLGNQFVEVATVHPGLDVYHDNVARPFSHAHFNELVVVLREYAASMPADERQDYDHVINRVAQQFGPAPEQPKPETLDEIINGVD